LSANSQKTVLIIFKSREIQNGSTICASKTTIKTGEVLRSSEVCRIVIFKAVKVSWGVEFLHNQGNCFQLGLESTTFKQFPIASKALNCNTLLGPQGMCNVTMDKRNWYQGHGFSPIQIIQQNCYFLP